MKTRTPVKCLVILMLVFSWYPVHANIINVLSQEYSVYGVLEGDYVYDAAANDWYPVDDVVKIYQETSASQVFLSESNGNASFAAEASGGVKPESANVKSSAAADCNGMAHSHASASASITFSPLVNYMLVFIWPGNQYENNTIGLHSYVLEDLTSGIILFSFNYYDLGYTLNNIIEFDTSHIYRISTSSLAGCPGGWSEESSLNLETVPEPSTMLLLGLGLVGLVGIRRKIKK